MAQYNFKRIVHVYRPTDFIDIILWKAQWKTSTVVHKHYKITRIRQLYMRKIKCTQQTFHDRLSPIVHEYPKLEDVHPFYADLTNVLYDNDHYKLALGQINKCQHMIGNISKDYNRLLKYGDSVYRCKQLKKAALGRMTTLMKKQASSLEYLEQVRQHLSRLPPIDSNTRTILACGIPNVGKSSFVNKRENVYTIPNLLCVIRMGMAPMLGYMVISEQYGPALGLFVVAGLTDLLDGWIARVVPGQSSVMGSFLDPMADKILVGVLFISLTYMDFIPVALTGLIISRDVLLIAAGFYIRYKSLDPPRTMARYFNVTHPTAQLAPTFISKINTGIQLGLVAATLVSTVIPYDLHPYLVTLWYCTATATIVSGLSYVFAKNTYKFLKRDPTSRRFRFSRDKRRDDKDERSPQA